MNGSCPYPDLCTLMRRHIHGRELEIWTEKFSRRPLDAWVCEEHRAAWIREAGVPYSKAFEACPWPSTKGEPQPPSIVEQTLNVVGAGVRFAASGFRQRPVEEVDRLHAICKGCDRYRPSDDRCAECGCYLLGNKLAWATEVCPIGKW